MVAKLLHQHLTKPDVDSRQIAAAIAKARNYRTSVTATLSRISAAKSRASAAERFSKWESTLLSPEQVDYAAKDVAASWDVWMALKRFEEQSRVHGGNEGNLSETILSNSAVQEQLSSHPSLKPGEAVHVLYESRDGEPSIVGEGIVVEKDSPSQTKVPVLVRIFDPSCPLFSHMRWSSEADGSDPSARELPMLLRFYPKHLSKIE
ncbi:hypothetical protein DFJ73DRAFT_91625 [Zopfochytrium polystomum]|nr:hypothetical protein DFJ73DRAFT_91625 [Zopfochytrium polystomum]